MIPRRFRWEAWDRLRASDRERFRALTIVTVLAWGTAFALTPRLWVSSGRSYPTVPVWPVLAPIPSPLDSLWFASLGILLALMPFERLRRGCIWLFLTLMIPLMLWDQSRWQVPIYQYLLLLASLGACPSAGEGVTCVPTLQRARVIIAATYVWCGLQKVNASFLRRVFPWFIGPFVAGWSEGLRSLLTATGVLVPPLEVAIGLGLLSQRYRRLAVVLAVVMHGAILFMLGPLGHRWDRFVWPWNAVMAASVLILFAGARDQSFAAVRHLSRTPYGMLMLLLVGVMPAFSFVDRWDAYLSWSAYSGNTTEAELRLSDAAVAGLSERTRRLVKPRRDGDNGLNLMMWSFDDLGVESYPEVRVYKRVARSVCRQTPDPTGIRLIIWERPPILDDRRPTRTYRCSEV